MWSRFPLSAPERVPGFSLGLVRTEMAGPGEDAFAEHRAQRDAQREAARDAAHRQLLAIDDPAD